MASRLAERELKHQTIKQQLQQHLDQVRCTKRAADSAHDYGNVVQLAFGARSPSFQAAPPAAPGGWTAAAVAALAAGRDSPPRIRPEPAGTTLPQMQRVSLDSTSPVADRSWSRWSGAAHGALAEAHQQLPLFELLHRSSHGSSRRSPPQQHSESRQQSSLADLPASAAGWSQQHSPERGSAGEQRRSPGNMACVSWEKRGQCTIFEQTGEYCGFDHPPAKHSQEMMGVTSTSRRVQRQLVAADHSPPTSSQRCPSPPEAVREGIDQLAQLQNELRASNEMFIAGNQVRHSLVPATLTGASNTHWCQQHSLVVFLSVSPARPQTLHTA